VGRLLITFLLCERGVLHRPLLYLSHYLKRHRSEYYERLQAVRLEGKWDEWIGFFLEGVRDVAGQATSTARDILQLREQDRQRVRRVSRIGGNLAAVLDTLYQTPAVTVGSLSRLHATSYPTAAAYIERLVEIGILEEISGRQRNRAFLYRDYVRLFDEPPFDVDR
jgi:Fic family protein